MSEHSQSFALRVELAELNLRADRAIEQSCTLAADQEFIMRWCRMRRHPEARQESVLDDW
jgi:hypothetical protein